MLSKGKCSVPTDPNSLSVIQVYWIEGAFGRYLSPVQYFLENQTDWLGSEQFLRCRNIPYLDQTCLTGLKLPVLLYTRNIVVESKTIDSIPVLKHKATCTKILRFLCKFRDKLNVQSLLIKKFTKHILWATMKNISKSVISLSLVTCFVNKAAEV